MTNTQTEVDGYAKAFAELTVPSLRARAAAAGIAGRSKMIKNDLVWALAKFEAAQTAGATEIDSAIEQVRGLAHAEALEINTKLTQVGRLERHPSIEARAAAYDLRDELLAAGFETQAIGDVPAELCGHGIARGRKCSICKEDANLGTIEETDGRCPFGNLHTIETCRGCGTEDEQGNQVTPTVETHTAPQAARPVTLMCAKSFYSNGERGICGVQQIPGPRGLHEGPHFDDHRRLWSDYTLPGDRRPLCGVEMPALPGMSTFTGPTRICRLILNADGECPDVNHKPDMSDYTTELAAALIEVQKQRHELRCALAHLVGRWSASNAASTRQLARVLDDVLKSHR